MDLTSASRLQQEAQLNNKFNLVFKTKAEYLFKAPARINLIGEHIDYNGGHVLPACVSLYIKCLLSIREDLTINLYSTSFKDVESFDLNNFNKSSDSSWTNYIKGAITILKSHGYIVNKGLNILYDSTIPLGSSLSSSAALLDVTIYALSNVFKFNISKKEIALMAREVENNYLNLSCGIMDQAIISLGKENSAMLLDCATFNYEYYPLNLDNYRFVILNTNVERKLTESKYNERVKECNIGLSLIKDKYNVENLCQIPSNELDNIRLLIKDDIIYKRVKHVISEESRVKEFCISLKNKDINKMAKLLNQSHKSLKEDYEVSGIYLDTIVEEAINYGALGSRMTGAGFSGCAIALIDKDKFIEFRENVSKAYFNKTNLKCDILLVDIVSGIE